MKSTLYSLIIFIVSISMHAQVGIGTTAPNGALDIISTNNGLLIPRVALVNTLDLTTVVTSTESELVYNTTPASGLTDVRPGFYYLSTPTGPWVRLGTSGSPPPPPPTSSGWLITGNDDIVDGTNFLGTMTGTNVDVAFKRNGASAGRIGASNTFFGNGAGAANTTSVNTYIGNAAGGNLSSGASGNNVAVGNNALNSGSGTVSNNVAIGVDALAGGAGNNNTAIGRSAGSANSGGNNNVMIGNNANISSGQESIAIGNNANCATYTNSIAIGTNANPGATNRIQIGGGNLQTATVNAPGWNFTSDRRLKSDIKDSQLGLDFIKTIRPVSYYRKADSEQKTEFGFIAQELETALDSAGITNTGILIKTADDMFAVRYNEFLPMTVKAVQEQQGLIEKLQKDNEELKEVNAAILKRLEALESKK